MFPRRHKPDPELKALVERVVEASIRHGQTVPDIAIAYVSLNPLERELDGETRERAGRLAESIAEDWRQAELAGATEATVIEDLQSDDVVDLLGAMQDSLILTIDDRHDHRRDATLISIDETTDRTRALANRDSLGRRPHPDDAPGEMERRFDELADGTVAALADVSTVYRELAPDGRELAEHEAESARGALERAAILGRDLDDNRELTAGLAERRDLRPSLSLLRSMQAGLVLALSSDPGRRAQAITVPELLDRIRPVYEGWKVPTEEQARG